ncbi:1,2-phenylacetyl-CoA epoxidase PaaB subunit [Spirochaeta isovalerica]|uniref:1,2-phenylacetyl-CoA epoxidase PaaB subunit n=1 Tax=Spirochaeta isovalerica TaxID=150 RepID=A0A841RA04_9SPIO|nr:1,2-phenylacetyl-CoA epoxidase PaaB subunit [Spirochaeta isovalerica]
MPYMIRRTAGYSLWLVGASTCSPMPPQELQSLG